MAPGTIEHARGFVNMDATNEEETKDTSLTNSESTDEMNGTEEQEKMPTQLKSLADLIHHCRDKGYQIYNDKTNKPESDKDRLKTFKETFEEDGKKHRADDPESKRRRKHQRNASISTHLSTKDFGSTKNGEFIERLSRQTSGKSSVYTRSQMTSGMSNITTSTEQPVGLIAADEWHQIRMRRKSRKRRDKNGSLVDIIKKKQEEVETMSNKTQNHEKVDIKQTTQQTMENNNSQLSSKREIPVDENVETILDEQHEEQRHKKQQHKKQKEHQQHQQQQLNTNSQDENSKELEMPPNDDKDNESERLINRSQQSREQHSPSRRSDDNSNHVIEEVRIKDGDTTLVLYKVKEIKESPSTTITTNNNTVSDLKETSNEDNLEDKSRVNPDDKNRMIQSNGEINRHGIVSESDITQGNHVHNSHKQFNNAETSTEQTCKGNSSDKNEQRVLNDNGSDTSDNRVCKQLTNNDASETIVAEHRYNDGDMIRGDAEQNSIANATMKHDTEYTSTNIGREKDTHLVLSNHTNERNGNNLEYKNESSEKNVSNGDKKAITREKIASNPPRSNKEETAKKATKDMTSVTGKPPKRSLGNGFLVSSNGDDDNAHTSVNKKTDSKKRALSKEKKQPSKKPHETEVRNMKSGTASNTSSKASSLTPDLRLVLLLTKARQTNQEYGEEHVKTLDLLKETRLGLRNDYLKLRNGIDIEDEEPAEKGDPPEVETEKPIEKEDSGEEEEEEEEAGDGEETGEAVDRDGIYVNVNRDIVKAIKQNASRKIDSRWNPDDRIIKKKSDAGKNNMIKRELKTKHETFDVSDLPNENEYVREAKRIYPKGFNSNTDVKKKSENHKTAKSNNSESNSKKEVVAVEVSKRSPPKVKVRHESPKKELENENNIPQTSENSRIKAELRKTKIPIPNANKSTYKPVKETAETPSNIKPPGERMRFTKVRNKPRNENGDIDNRLEIDRAFAKEYESYLKNKQLLPGTRSDNHRATQNKFVSTNKNNKENLPKIDDNVKRRNKVDTNHNITNTMVNGSVNGNSECAGSDLKENKREYVEDKSSNESISGAVDIVKSRGKFYNEVNYGSERRFQSRDNRVLKLFKEIQYVRRMVGPYSERFPSNDLDEPSFSDPDSGFLFMNYNSSCENRPIRGQRSDQALNRFLYEEMDYEVCSKMKTVNMSHRKRDRAFETLRQKLFSKVY